MDINLTEFQTDCIESLKRIFLEIGLDAGEEVRGVDETYVRFALRSHDHSFEIYIYADGADFAVDGKTKGIFEIQDYDSLDTLAHDFLMTVKSWLLGSPPPERPTIWQMLRSWRPFGD